MPGRIRHRGLAGPVRPSIALWCLLMALALMIPIAPTWAQPAAHRIDDFISKVSPSELVPGADRFGPIVSKPAPAAPVYAGDKLVGHAFLNSQYVNTAGYSSLPIDIVVGVDLAGTITGLKLVEHHEPIVLIGIPEKRVIDYMRPFIGFNPIEAVANKAGMPKTDIVSGATVTVLVMGESVVRSALRVGRAYGLGTAAAAAGAASSAAAPAAPAREFDPQAGEVSNWKTLIDQGAVSHMHLTIGQVNEAFDKSGNAAAAKRPEPGDPQEQFIDLWVALVSQPAIGRTLLGEAEYKNLQSMLKPGQHAILVGGEGPYSFKGSGYVRGGIFDRIELVQGDETIRFRDYQHRRLGSLAPDDAPRLKELGLFLIPDEVTFNPVAPMRLQLLVARSISALDKAFVSFDLDYQLPAVYTKAAPAPVAAAAPGPAAGAAAGPGQPAAAGAPAVGVTHAPVGTAHPTVAGAADAIAPAGAIAEDDPFAALESTPLWQRIWESKVASMVMLGLMLIALTFIFFFQDWLVKREKLFDRIRLGYLTLTLVWLGWVASAQLSVVNVLTFTTALRGGFDWTFFLVDPLIFILWCSVAAALLFWGRGPFCGWLCPFGALQELANRAAKAVKIPQVRLPWGVHERLWPVKYIIFLVLFGVSLGSLSYAEMLAEVEPFKTAIILRFMRDWWFVAFALLLIGAGLFIERFFCRYLCPLGAALAIPGRMRMFDWLKRYRECGNPCMRCFNECPVEAIHPEGHINPNECISCLHCQVLYHHDRKCPVMIQRRVKREKREGVTQPGAHPPVTPSSATARSRPASAT